MTATLHSTDLDADRCPRCGIHLAGTDVVDKAKAWTALAEKNAEIARLCERLAGCEAIDLKRREKIEQQDAEIERLRGALVEIADPTLTGNERMQLARTALGWHIETPGLTDKR